MRARTASFALALPVRLAIFSAMWWALTEGDTSTWSYAAAIVPLTVLVSLAVLPPQPVRRRWARRALAAVSLTGWFLWQSVKGGVDIAERSLRRPVRVDAGLVTYHWRLAAGPARITVMNLLNLMPGSLSVRAEGDLLVVHVVDTQMPVIERLQTLEGKVAAVVGVELDLQR